jgi:hypothetical protein
MAKNQEARTQMKEKAKIPVVTGLTSEVPEGETIQLNKKKQE